MDAFEQLISEILWMEGYWVRTSVKVHLTPIEKREINRPTAPRWELDIVAYSGQKNLLKIVECKSYLDSRGVMLKAFDGTSPKDGQRYKLFSEDDNLRNVIFRGLRQQLFNVGACREDTEIQLCLACGRIASNKDRIGLHEHFARRGWELLDEFWIKERLNRMADLGYENQVSAVVSKLLLRGSI